jgi:Transposase IS116/IS110/IS902 family
MIECFGSRSKRSQGSAPRFDLRSELYRISGVDLTRIDGIHSLVAQTVISEVGLDMSRWNTEAHFASWLGLSPDNRISGDKVLSKGTRHVVNRAATALRMAATTLLRSQSYLGAQYRRLRTKLRAPKAITAMAHKLASGPTCGVTIYGQATKYGQQRRRSSVQVIVNLGIDLKHWFHEERSVAVSGFSYPSGHSVSSSGAVPDDRESSQAVMYSTRAHGPQFFWRCRRC